MKDVATFVQTYTAASRQFIVYAGSCDPLADPVAPDLEFLRKDDPNCTFRDEVIKYLFPPKYWDDGLMHTVSDELLHDLHVANIEHAVGHCGDGRIEMALEILRRNMYETFVYAYALRLGQDQGMPLERAVFQCMRERENDAPARALLLALDARMTSEKDPRARANLEHWRPWLERLAVTGEG